MMKSFNLLLFLLLYTGLLYAQDICNPAGNIMIYSNYEGGTLNIDVDTDIEDLKIGICTYEEVTVNITGTFAANVTEVYFAGFNVPDISGVDPAIVTVYAAAIGDIAIASVLGDELFGAPIVNCMVGAEGCDETAAGGGNASPQIVQFFKDVFDDDDVFYAHYTDYSFFSIAPYSISDGGNCCIEDPITPPNPIYVDEAGYSFFDTDTLLLCDGDTTLDLSFYEVVWGEPTWSTGLTDYALTITEPGTYSFIMSDYCHYDPFYLTDTIVVLPCATEILVDICAGTLYILPDGTITSTAGTYEFTLTAADGSDSTVIVEVVVHPNSTVHLYDTICEGESYVLPDGTTTTDEGTYYFTFLSVWSCDSFVYAHLEVLEPVFAAATDSFCVGGNYTLPDGVVVDVPGDYVVNLTTVAGCDSVLTLTLEHSTPIETLVSAEICPGGTFTLPDGIVVTDAGLYNAVLTTPDGCDSTIVTTITLSDTLLVEIDTGICLGDTYLLPDGSAVSDAGLYEVLLFPPDVDCITRYQITLQVENPVAFVWNLPPFACIDNPAFTLEAEPSGGIFTGSGVTSNQFNPALAGVGGPYTLTYTYTSVLGCVSTATATISVTQNYAEAGSDVYITIGDTTILNVFTEGIPTWSPASGLSCTDCYSPSASPQVTTTYTVTSVDEGGCTSTDQVTVYVDTEPVFTYFIPNTFTPNGDGMNDVFTAYGTDLLQIASLRVYDRWGALLFEALELAPGSTIQGWDGTRNGEAVQPGVYAYVAELRFRGDFRQTVAGNITIVR